MTPLLGCIIDAETEVSLMAHDSWRHIDLVVVPAVVGLHLRDADRVAYNAGLKLARPDPDGPPLAALTWSDDFWVTKQIPPPGTRMWRWDSLVIEWSAQPGGAAGVREPRRPGPPDNTLPAEEPLPQADSV